MSEIVIDENSSHSASYLEPPPNVLETIQCRDGPPRRHARMPGAGDCCKRVESIMRAQQIPPDLS